MSVKLRERKLAKGAIKYYLDIYSSGNRHYEFLDVKIEATDSKSVKTEKKNIAKLIRSQRELELITESTNYTPKHLKNINFFDYAENFVKNYKKKDIRMIEASLKKFTLYSSNRNLRMIDITPSLMNGFKEFLIDSCSLKRETPYNYFTRFKKILKEAELDGLLKVSPTANIRFPRKNNIDEIKKQILNSEELQLLAITPCGNKEIKKAFLFACFTGLGYAEIKNLKWIHIKKDRLVSRREKTDQKIDIKLKENILTLLGKRRKNQDPVFNLTNEKGNYISDNGVNKCLKNWVKRAKIDKHITFYCGRHTFATQLLQYGANLKTVADALGHTNTRNTIKYLNYIDNLKDDAVDNVPDLNF